MAFGKNIRTYFNGQWHDGDLPVMRAADHGIWQGSSVFDGARLFGGLVPDLGRHLTRVNASAEALMITPTLSPADMFEIAREGLSAYPRGAAVYIRPMYWAIDGSELGVAPAENSTAFAMSLEEVPMPWDWTGQPILGWRVSALEPRLRSRAIWIRMCFMLRLNGFVKKLPACWLHMVMAKAMYSIWDTAFRNSSTQTQ